MKTEIDLHGCRLEDAQQEVMRFVDQLYYNGETEGRIVHGLGAIAERLGTWLDEYPYVKGYERSPLNAGVTIVRLEVR